MKVLNKKGENHEKNCIGTFFKFGYGDRHICTFLCKEKGL
jgi:hypothetical protein